MAENFKNALILYNKQKFSDVIRILEPQVFRFRDNFEFYHLLGMSCLFTGDYGGAYSYLRRAITINEDDIVSLLGIAAVYLKRGDTGNALRIWLDVVELDPDNTYAARGLNFLKKNAESDYFTGVAAQERLQKFIPVPGKRKNNLKYLLIPAAILILLLIAVQIIPGSLIPAPVKVVKLIDFFDKASSRPELPDVELDARKEFTELTGSFSYTFSEKEVEKLLKDIQDYLYDFRDNIAMREINRLLLSNATEYVKDRARLLSEYIRAPEITDVKDNFTYAEVLAEPALYRGCYILWKGKTTNVFESEDVIRFDFLVGYHEEKNLEGVLPVEFNFGIRVNTNQAVALLARIDIDNSSRIVLKGKAIQRLF